MTITELSKYYSLSRETEQIREQLAELEQQMWPSSPSTDGMPKGTSTDSQVERIALKIAETRSELAGRMMACVSERLRLEKYISSIDDSDIRMIFELRFVERLPWDEVADAMEMTTSAVRKRCYRYLDGEKTENPK